MYSFLAIVKEAHYNLNESVVFYLAKDQEPYTQNTQQISGCINPSYAGFTFQTNMN